MVIRIEANQRHKGNTEMEDIMKEASSVREERKIKTVPTKERVERFKKIADMDFSKIGATVSTTYVGFHQQGR